MNKYTLKKHSKGKAEPGASRPGAGRGCRARRRCPLAASGGCAKSPEGPGKGMCARLASLMGKL